MLNLIQHLTKSRTNKTLKQVQGDKPGLFERPSKFEDNVAERSGICRNETDANKWHRYKMKRAY